MQLKVEHLKTVVDSKEETPWDLRPMVPKTTGLSVGDNSIRGLESVVAVERKSLEDFRIDVAKMNWFAEFSWFTKILATSQHPDIRIHADTQQKSPSAMNNIKEFLNASTFAVAGASRARSKYGNKVFLALVASGRTVYPLNPTAPEVEGQTAYASIAEFAL